MADAKAPLPPSTGSTRVSAQEALDRTAGLRAGGDRPNPTLAVTLKALRAVVSGERSSVELGAGEAGAVVDFVTGLQRDLGAARAHVGRLTEAATESDREVKALRGEVNDWIAKGQQLVRRIK